MGDYDVSIIIVSYNTRELTLACLRSVYAQTEKLRFEIILVDNASTDGSADAIANELSDVRLIRSEKNLGFAGGCNLGAAAARGQYVLLLNPDTRVLNSAIEKLVSFAQQHPQAGIYGGRTLNEDGTLNPMSCWARPTPWSFFCRGVGLTNVFPNTRIFDPETYGSWRRDSVREVDIITGCLLLIEREIWNRLEGFDPGFFMYSEEADLCLRAGELGYRPMLSPEVEIVHHGGASPCPAPDRLIQKLSSKRRLISKHWPKRWQRFAGWMQALWIWRRRMAWGLLSLVGYRDAAARAQAYGEVWQRHSEWAVNG